MMNIVGFTSSANLKFVKETGFYDTVYTYDQYEVSGLKRVSIVDFSGNNAFIRKLTKQIGNELIECVVVGATHHLESDLNKLLGGEEYQENEIKPAFFFAPSAAKVIAKEDSNFSKNVSESFKQFIFSEFCNDKVKVTHVGFKDAINVYLAYVNNKVKSDESYVCFPSKL